MTDLPANIRRLLAQRPASRQSLILNKLTDARTTEADVLAALAHLERTGEVESWVARGGRGGMNRRTKYRLDRP